MNPALKQEISVFCEPEHPKKHATPEIHLFESIFFRVWLAFFLLPVLRPFLTRKFFQENFGLEGSKTFLGKFRQVHNLNISGRLLRSKSFFQENISGLICSVFRCA